MRLRTCAMLAAARLSRVLWNYPAIGIRHADAGYELAKEIAENNDLYFTTKL